MPGQALGPSEGKKQIVSQEHLTLQADTGRNPPPRMLKKNPPTNNLAAAVAREMRDACGTASRLVEPLPPPWGAFSWCHRGGEGPGQETGAGGSHSPIVPRCPQSRGRGPDNGLMDNRGQQMVSPPPTRQLVPFGLPGVSARSEWGPRPSWLQTTALHLPTLGFWKEA